jgi:hypothetical protein
MTIQFNNFVRRQTESSPFSHWNLSDEQLLNLVNNNFSKAANGYRDGVILVPVEPEGFFSSVVKLNAGDKLEGEFKARKEGEDPRKTIHAKGTKMPAKSVSVVLYRKDVLAEGKENSTDADWEIVSINANPEVGEMPIQPDTLIANHFQLSGGTSTNMSDSEFVEALRVSVMYWKDKAMSV